MATFEVGLLQLLMIFCSLFYCLQAQTSTSVGKSLPDIGLLKSCNIDKIYQFGASKSDTGNHRIEDPLDKCNFHPYGQSFPRGPTGRCSNGLLMIDYIASAAGIPFLNPYLNSTANFSHGVNFAVGGSTSLPVRKDAIVSHTRDSLDVQLNWMSTFFDSWCTSHTRKKTLFIVGEIGNNDYDYALHEGKTIEEIKSKLMPQVVQSITDAVRKVISVGAVRIVVPGQFPLGCFPVYLTMFQSNSTTAYDTHQCLKALNDLAAVHNNYLQHAINSLQKQNPNTKIVYFDYYNAFKWLLSNAPYIGLDAKSTLKACCGIGGKYNQNLQEGCGSPTVPVCPDPDRHISWDGLHLTQKTNRLVATWLVADFLPKIDCIKHIEIQLQDQGKGFDE